MLEHNAYGEWLRTISKLRDFTSNEITFLYRWNTDILDAHRYVEMNIIYYSREHGDTFEISTKEHGIETILRRDVLAITNDTRFRDDELWDIIFMLQRLIDEGLDRL